MNGWVAAMSVVVVLAFMGTVLTAMIRSVGVLLTAAVWASSALFTAAVWSLATWGGAK